MTTGTQVSVTELCLKEVELQIANEILELYKQFCEVNQLIMLTVLCRKWSSRTYSVEFMTR